MLSSYTLEDVDTVFIIGKFSDGSIRELPKLIEENRADGRRAIRRAVRQWVRGQ